MQEEEEEEEEEKEEEEEEEELQEEEEEFLTHLFHATVHLCVDSPYFFNYSGFWRTPPPPHNFAVLFVVMTYREVRTL